MCVSPTVIAKSLTHITHTHDTEGGRRRETDMRMEIMYVAYIVTMNAS